MSKKANPTLIGGFVVGAVVLAVAAITYFGGGEFLAKEYTFVAFFEGTHKGLNIGAPVTYGGIRIGTVSNVVVRYDAVDKSVRIPVYFEIEQGRIEAVRARARDPYQCIRALIDDGLRAQLVTQSFVTGQIAVQLDFHSNEPAVFVGADPNFFEFPTIPSTMEKMGKALENFDLDGLLSDIRNAIKGIDELAQSSDLRDAIASLDGTIQDIGKLARDANTNVSAIADDIDQTGVSARRALDQFGESVASVENTLNPGIEDVRKSIVDLLAEDSELYCSLVAALDELAAAVHSIRMLADLLEQHPEALLQGKATAGAK